MTEPQLLLVTVIPPNASLDAAESEPVLIEFTDRDVALTLDDGTQVVFDRQELIVAIANEYGRSRAHLHGKDAA